MMTNIDLLRGYMVSRRFGRGIGLFTAATG